ncbi:Hemicentin-1 [Merluccius polli]|uniref:B-cell receptor CD22 n=1 Tax=Merluccius polli TaxID=89951 RepID=A0AA47P0E4_MERPO|nr:Hemicentin-1 [Merluccius polli]
MTCLFFTALQGYDDWGVIYTSSNVCALRGSTVEISCTYRYPKEQDGRYTTVQKTLWFTKTDGDEYVDLRNDTDYADRVEYSCEVNSCNRYSCNVKCTLRIRDLRLSDSAAEYKFRFITNQPARKYTGDPGVTLSVTDLQVKVSFPDPTNPTLAYLLCHSMCGLAGPYIWTRRGQSVGGGRSYRVYIKSEDILSCACVSPLHSALTSCQDAPETPSVTVRPSGEIEEGSSVTLSCSSDANPAAKNTWFKDNTDNSYRDINQGQQLVFGHIKSSDSGQYLCEAKNELGTKSASISINVKYGPKHTSVTSSPSGGVKEGSSVTLSCSSDANPAANYTWFKDNTVYRDMNQRQQLVFDRIKSSDSGKYLCEAKNELGTKSASITINVKYGPKHTSVTSSPSGEIEEGSSVTLSCSSDANPAAKCTWFKVNTDNSSRDMNQGQQLVFGHIKSSDSGQYLCEAKNELGTKSASISINVKYGPKHTSVISSPSGGVKEGSSVTLSCSSDANPAAKYTWFKDNTVYRDMNQRQQLVFDRIKSSDSGKYLCEAKNELGTKSASITINVKYGPKHTSVTSSPYGEIEEGSSVTLSCSSDANPAAKYTWFKVNTDNSSRDMNQGQQLVFGHIKSSDSGQYLCEAKNELGTKSASISINVKYGPKHTSVTSSPSGGVKEGSSVTLSCSSDANPAAKYTWFKEHEDSVIESGQNYTITNITSELGGNYYCQAHNAIGRHNSTFLSISSLPVPVYENISALTNSSSPSVQREPIELQDLLCPIRSEAAGPVLCALQGYDDWRVTYTSSDVCALRRSTVEISCTYEYAKKEDGQYTTVQKTLWFTKRDGDEYVDLRRDTDYADRVEYSCGENSCYSYSCYVKCTLRIRDLRLSDSAAEYKFQFITNQPGGRLTGEPGVTLSVTDLQVKVSFPNPTYPTWAYLECHSMCGLADPYIWTRSGQSVRRGRSYRCVSPLHSALTSCQDAPKTPSVTVRPSGEIQEGSSVTLSCSSDANPAANYTWFKDHTDDSSRYMNQGQQLVFGPIKSSDSGQYYCLVETELRTKSASIYINVKYGPKHTSVISSPSGGVKEGSSVTLSCSSDANPAAKYTWFKNNQTLLWKPIQRYTFTSVHSEDRGTYRCQAENEYGRLSSNWVFIDVQYGPKHTSVISSPSGGVKEGSSVTLSCSSDANPAANYTWFKDNTDNSSRDMNQGQQLVFGHIKSSDSGKYLCEAKNEFGTKSASISINVKYGPKHTSVTSSPSGGVKEGSSVTLSCSSDANPAANYTWFKNNQPLLWKPIQRYTFTSVHSEDRGKYLLSSREQIWTSQL